MLLLVVHPHRCQSGWARSEYIFRSRGETEDQFAGSPSARESFGRSRAREYIADGMTDELTTMLAKNSTLRVISRTSVMQYKGVHRPLPEIARELGVDGILEGSVERTGDKVHMTIQLIQAQSDTHVWAESYDRDANDVVSLPREAAQTIAKKLNSAAPQTSPQRYVNPEAHDAYLRGQYVWFAGKNEGAGKYFRKATELQPDYAPRLVRPCDVLRPGCPGWRYRSQRFCAGRGGGPPRQLNSLMTLSRWRTLLSEQ